MVSGGKSVALGNGNQEFWEMANGADHQSIWSVGAQAAQVKKTRWWDADG